MKEEIAVSTDKLKDGFIYHYKDARSCNMKLIEVVPDKKVVTDRPIKWQVESVAIAYILAITDIYLYI